MKFFGNIYKRAIVATLPVLGSVAAFAEGETGGTGGTANEMASNAITQWVGTAEATMSGWGTTLAPLFSLGVGLVLLVVAWRLFKRTTKSAT